VLNNIISLLFLMNQFLWISWTMSNHEIQNSQGWFRDMMFNATFNNISVISWRVNLFNFMDSNFRGGFFHACYVLSRIRKFAYPLLESLNIYWGKYLWILHYVIKFVSDLRQVGGFLWVLLFPSPIKLTATI
jgi:hypothetical protein